MCAAAGFITNVYRDGSVDGVANALVTEIILPVVRKFVETPTGSFLADSLLEKTPGFDLYV